MPASVCSMAVQKKQSVIPPAQGPLSAHIIQNQKRTRRFEKRENGCNSKPLSRTKKTSVSVKKFDENCSRGPGTTAGNGPNIDERLKAARERREKYQKSVASRELERQEREQRARRFYEQQLQERKRKLQEQRQKEETRRAAVEEKRQQRLREEKERHESAVRKTHEKSQRAIKHISEHARGRKTTKNVSFHSMNAPTTPSPPKPQHQSATVCKRPSASPSANNRPQRSISPAQVRPTRQQASVKTHAKNVLNSNPAAAKAAAVKQQRSPASPSPQRSARRSVRRPSSSLQLELPAVPEEDVTLCSSALCPGNSRPVKTVDGGHTGENLPKADPLNPADTRKSSSSAADHRDLPHVFPHSAPPTPEAVQRSAGTTDPEDGYRLLAERRRQARLQREKEEEEERQRQEEAERQKQHELESRKAAERAKHQAEAQRFLEEKRRREEEEQRRAEEERAQAMKEAVLLQKHREEEQAKQQARAEQMKQEQQKAEAERQTRKKRLEEIMRRTRRTESPDTNSVPVRILPKDAQPKENTEPVSSSKLEEAVSFPAGTKTAQLGLNNDADMVPAVAFKERRSLRMLSGLEEIQAHQRAEVI